MSKITFAQNHLTMELLYVWIKDYKNIKAQGFNFSPAWRFRYESQSGRLHLEDRRDKIIPNFFGADVSNVTAIVGENGSGKSNLMEFLVRLFDRGTGFWDELFIVAFFTEGQIRVWYFADLPLQVPSNIHGVGVLSIAFKMRVDENGIRGGIRGENDIDRVNFVYYSQHIDGLKKGFGMNRNRNFLDISDARFMTKKTSDERGEREEFVSPNEYYLGNVRRQALFFGGGGKQYVDFPVPHFLKITVNEDVNPDALTAVFRGKSSSVPPNYGADEIWNFLDRPGFVAKAFRALIFSALVDSSAMTVLGSDFIEGLKNKIGSFPQDESPFRLIDDWEDAAGANWGAVSRLTSWLSEKCGDFIHDQIPSQIFEPHEDALILPADSLLMEQFFRNLEAVDIKLSLPFKFSWTFKDDPQKEGGLSSGYNHLLNFFARIYKNRFAIWGNYPLLFYIDEGELGLHPQLQKQYLEQLISIVPLFIPRAIGSPLKIQFILTSHSPFILSDLPRENVIFLEKNEDGTCKVADGLQDTKQTFGANIHTLLSDAFFLKKREGLMGDFAKTQIDKVIRFYQEGENIDFRDEAESEEFAEKVIEMIGEPIIRRYLRQLQQAKAQKHLHREIEVLKYEVQQLKTQRKDDQNTA